MDVPNEYLEKIFHINLISHWYTTKEFLPGMIKQKKGHVVTTSSMASYTAVAGMVRETFVTFVTLVPDASAKEDMARLVWLSFTLTCAVGRLLRYKSWDDVLP